MGEKAKSKGNKKRKSISTKIASLVVTTVIIAMLVCTFICTESAKNQIGRAVQNNMLTMIEIYAASMNEIEEKLGEEQISYDEMAALLEGD